MATVSIKREAYHIQVQQLQCTNFSWEFRQREPTHTHTHTHASNWNTSQHLELFWCKGDFSSNWNCFSQKQKNTNRERKRDSPDVIVKAQPTSASARVCAKQKPYRGGVKIRLILLSSQRGNNMLLMKWLCRSANTSSSLIIEYKDVPPTGVCKPSQRRPNSEHQLLLALHTNPGEFPLTMRAG